MFEKLLEYLHKLWYSIFKIKRGAINMKDKKINRDIIENSYYMINLFDRDKKDRNVSITNLKLQKLMYFVEAYYMVDNPEEQELFSSSWSAWDYGPVNRKLYNCYKKFGSMEIALEPSQVSIGNNLPDTNKKYIERIYSLFADFSAFDLVTLTHLKGSPWDEIFEKNKTFEQYNFQILNDSEIDKLKTKEWFASQFSFLFHKGKEEE